MPELVPTGRARASRKGPSLALRLKHLDEAVDLARGRAADEVVDAADALIGRAGERLSISGDHTVVALAGATGSGKSSTFNALSGGQLATTGVTRPTTSEAMAVAWGTDMPVELLDWLGVRRRHLVAGGDATQRDLVLLDLPDHDSTEVAHRLTVDRLVELVDMLIWVVDPQKYADGALHDGYLKPLADHAEVMVVVLNQADRLTPEQLRSALADLRRLLDSEGLRETRVLAMSARTGEGVDALRSLLAETTTAKAMTAKRFAADVSRHARLLGDELGSAPVPTLSAGTRERVHEAMADAAAVPVVVDGVVKAWRHRGTIATGWPLVSWVKRLRPDPLRKLRVGLSPKELSPTDVSRTSLPKASSVQRARLDAALRGLIEASVDGVPRGWADRIRQVARGNERVLADKMDAAVASTDLRMGSGHGWWVLVTILQWLLVLAMVVGGVWLALPLVFALLQAPIDLPVIAWQGWPLQTILLVGGAVGGVLLGLLSRVLVEAGAQVKGRQARRALTESVARVVDAEVIDPVAAELARLTAAREATRKAA